MLSFFFDSLFFFGLLSISHSKMEFFNKIRIDKILIKQFLNLKVNFCLMDWEIIQEDVIDWVLKGCFVAQTKKLVFEISGESIL